MKKLIIARHGEDDKARNPQLNANGRKQVTALSERLGPIINTDSVLILSSPTLRARQSADILSGKFGCAYIEQHEVLQAEIKSTPEEFLPKVFDLVTANKHAADVIILVTHKACAWFFASHFGKKEFGTPKFPMRECGNGDAYVIDCESKSCVQIEV